MDPYKPHGVPIVYEGREIVLNPEAEEVATHFAQTIGSPYDGKERFMQNAWEALQAKLPPDTPIKRFKDIDFSKIRDKLNAEREMRAERGKEEKEEEAMQNKAKAAPYIYALVNGFREKVG